MSSARPEVLRYSAFSAAAGGGNPAGVVLDATGLTEQSMRRVAAEVGYSETAFVVGHQPDPARTYTLRYWSPAAEVPFCGHATVATAVALAERDGPGTMTFGTPVGDVTLAAAPDASGQMIVSFTSVEPQTRELAPAVLDRLLDLLGLTAADLDPDHPVLEAFAGNWHPILTLPDPEIFHQFRFAPAPVAELMRAQGWLGTVTVLHPSGSGEYQARNLFPVGRINEDPATGSAAASTGAYLRAIGHARGGETIVIRQGAHVGRPSLLTVHIPAAGGITVSGGATRLADPS